MYVYSAFKIFMFQVIIFRRDYHIILLVVSMNIKLDNLFPSTVKGISLERGQSRVGDIVFIFKNF